MLAIEKSRVRVDPDVYEKLVKIYKEQGITITFQVNQILRKGLAK